MKLLLSIDHHNGVPAYRQIIDQVKLHTAAGVLAPGTEMPSTRALSAELSLNPMTISKAYSLLEHDGVLERRRGQTLVVAEHDARTHEDSRIAPLRNHLRAAATLARQLGIPREQALKLFRESLSDSSSP